MRQKYFLMFFIFFCVVFQKFKRKMPAIKIHHHHHHHGCANKRVETNDDDENDKIQFSFLTNLINFHNLNFKIQFFRHARGFGGRRKLIQIEALRYFTIFKKENGDFRPRVWMIFKWYNT